MKALLSAALGLALLGTVGQTIAAPNCSIKLKGDDTCVSPQPGESAMNRLNPVSTGLSLAITVGLLYYVQIKRIRRVGRVADCEGRRSLG